MHPNEFITALDEGRIVAAIASAEELTSGEIRVAISHRHRRDSLAAARRRFHQLHMDRTKQRNAVLIYMVPRDRVFALWGDVGVHDACGEAAWQAIAAKLKPLLKIGEFNAAIELAVREVGAILARSFPRKNAEGDRLSNSVVRD